MKKHKNIKGRVCEELAVPVWVKLRAFDVYLWSPPRQLSRVAACRSAICSSIIRGDSV